MPSPITQPRQSLSIGPTARRPPAIVERAYTGERPTRLQILEAAANLQRLMHLADPRVLHHPDPDRLIRAYARVSGVPPDIIAFTLSGELGRTVSEWCLTSLVDARVSAAEQLQHPNPAAARDAARAASASDILDRIVPEAAASYIAFERRMHTALERLSIIHRDDGLAEDAYEREFPGLVAAARQRAAASHRLMSLAILRETLREGWFRYLGEPVGVHGGDDDEDEELAFVDDARARGLFEEGSRSLTGVRPSIFVSHNAQVATARLLMATSLAQARRAGPNAGLAETRAWASHITGEAEKTTLLGADGLRDLFVLAERMKRTYVDLRTGALSSAVSGLFERMPDLPGPVVEMIARAYLRGDESIAVGRAGRPFMDE